MCIQFRSYLRGARFTLRMDHMSLVWLHRFKDTEGMMSRWLHTLQQFQFSIVHRPAKDHRNVDGLSHVPSSPCRQCTRLDCLPVTIPHHDTDQPFDSVSTGSSEDADLVPVQYRVRIGLPGWTMSYHNRLLSLKTHFVFQPCIERAQYASHYIHGLSQMNFPHGWM